MKFLRKVIKRIKSTSSNSSLFKRKNFIDLGFFQSQTNRIENDGYPAQVHKVVTSDGYILQLDRIGNGTSVDTSQNPRVPVFLMHGLLETASSWIALGPEHSLGMWKKSTETHSLFNSLPAFELIVLSALSVLLYMQQLIYCTIMDTMYGWVMLAVHDHHEDICISMQLVHRAKSTGHFHFMKLQSTIVRRLSITFYKKPIKLNSTMSHFRKAQHYFSF